jgi:hypothetical protein
MKAGRTPRSGVSNIPLIWRLRLVLHGVRLSPFAHDDLTTAQGARLVAYRIQMNEHLLIGADSAPIDARVNIRAASFVLRHFGLHMAELRTDARGALLSLKPGYGELAVTGIASDAQAGRKAAAAGVGYRN